MLREGSNALPFMKATYSHSTGVPIIGLPPEILEMVYMYCTSGTMTAEEMRNLYSAGVLYGMDGVNGREIVHAAVYCGLLVSLSPPPEKVVPFGQFAMSNINWSFAVTGSSPREKPKKSPSKRRGGYTRKRQVLNR